MWPVLPLSDVTVSLSHAAAATILICLRVEKWKL